MSMCVLDKCLLVCVFFFFLCMCLVFFYGYISHVSYLPKIMPTHPDTFMPFRLYSHTIRLSTLIPLPLIPLINMRRVTLYLHPGSDDECQARISNSATPSQTGIFFLGVRVTTYLFLCTLTDMRYNMYPVLLFFCVDLLA